MSEIVQGLVSVIIPAWQTADTIGITLSCLDAQSYDDIEVIVVDDGSTDDLQQAIAPWSDWIRCVSYGENRGAPAARNYGLTFAKGEYVMFCDSDLRLKLDAIEHLVETLKKHPSAAYAYGSFRFGWKRFQGGPFSADRLRSMNYIHTSALIRRSAEPHFDEQLRRFQDWDLWLTLLEQGKVGVWYPDILFTAIPRGRLGMSVWRPTWWYSIPWERLGYVPKSVQSYRAAKAVIVAKHGLVTGTHLSDIPKSML